MALDPSIFYNFAALRAQDNARLGQTLGNAVQSYQDRRAKEAELKNRGLDINKMAESAIFKAYSGEQLTPQEIAAVRTKSALEGQKVTYQPDAEGNVRAVSQPTLWDTFSAMQGVQQYKPAYPAMNEMMPMAPAPDAVSRQPLPPISGMEGITPISEADLMAQVDRIPLQRPAALTPQQEAALAARGDMFAGEAPPLPGTGGRIQAPMVEGAGPKTEQALREAAGRAAVDLSKKEAEIPLEVRLAREREQARKQAEVEIKTETSKAEKVQRDADALPLLQSMLQQNAQTLPIPFAGVGAAQVGSRIFTPEASKQMDLLQQNRLNLAAPLAKALGVNPTDKDFKATLDRIVDVNSTRESRDAQIRQLMRQIVNKNPEAAGLPKGTKEYGTSGGRMVYQLPDGSFVMEQ